MKESKSYFNNKLFIINNVTSLMVIMIIIYYIDLTLKDNIVMSSN